MAQALGGSVKFPDGVGGTAGLSLDGNARKEEPHEDFDRDGWQQLVARRHP